MKLFKKIYFTTLAVLLALAVVFSLVENSVSLKSSPLDTAAVKTIATNLIAKDMDKSQTEITEQLKAIGISSATDKVNASGKNEASTSLVGGAKVPTFVVQETSLTTAEHREFSLSADSNNQDVYLKLALENIIVYLPSNNANAKTVAIFVPYANTTASEAVAVAAAVKTIEQLKTQKFDNNIVFVFADSNSGAGTYAFLTKFIGFENVVSSITTSISYDMSGNGGIVTLGAIDTENYNTINAISKAGVNASSFASAFACAAADSVDYLAASVKSISFGIGNNGGKEYASERGDIAANLTDSLIRQTAASVYNVSNYFGNADLDLNAAEGNFVYFNYLGFITIAYPVLAAMILLALIVGLLAAIVLVNLKVKAFDFTKSAWGLIGALCTLVATAITLFVVYLLTSLMMSGFGVISFRNIFNLGYSSIGLIIGAMLLTTALSIGYSALFKKLFNSKSYDLVLGNAVLVSIIAVIAGFIIPKAAFALVAFATLELVVILINTIFKAKFKEKNNFDITRLFLVFAPIVIAAPIVISSIVSAGLVLGAMWYPVIFTAFSLVVGFMTPYFTLLNPVFEAVFAKLPKRTVRIERTEKVEVTPVKKIPKKGKNANPAPIFEEKKVIVKEKRDRKYSVHFISGLIAVISCVVIVCCSAGGNINANYSKNNPVSYLDNALVYHLDSDNSISKWEVHDLKAYTYISSAVSGLKWDADKQIFSKVDYEDSSKVKGYPTTSQGTKTYAITPFDASSSIVVLDFTFNTRPSTMKIRDKNGNDIFSLSPTSDDKNIQLTIPKGTGAFTIVVTGTMSASVAYAEYNQNPGTLAAYEGWLDFTKSYEGTEVASSVKSLLLITKTLSISL